MITLLLGMLVSSANADTLAEHVRARCRCAQAVEITKEIRRAARDNRVNYKLLAAILETESNFKPWAYGSTGDHGIAQINYRLAEDYKVPIRNLYDYRVGINLAAKQLAKLKKMYPHDRDWYCRYNVGAYGAMVPWRLRACRKYASKVTDKLNGLKKYYVVRGSFDE